MPARRPAAARVTAAAPADSPALRALFPAGVVAAELHGPGAVSLLHPDAIACVVHAVSARAGEFAAGRLCARRALAQLGIVDFPLRMAADRSAVWPPTVVGSISHTAGYCGAVAGERAKFGGLGLDTEVVAAVGAQLWPRLCAPLELTRLHALPAAHRPRAAALMFSAKEAFYKAQYPLLGARLEFDDVMIEAACPDAGLDSRADGGSGEFTVIAGEAVALRLSGQRLRGRYRFHDGFVSAGIALLSGR